MFLRAFSEKAQTRLTSKEYLSGGRIGALDNAEGNIYTFNLDPRLCLLLLQEHRPQQFTFAMTVENLPHFLDLSQQLYGPDFMAEARGFVGPDPHIANLTVAEAVVYHAPGPAVST